MPAATIGQRRVGRTALTVSELGFGGAPLGGAMRSLGDAEGLDAVAAALEMGITYFDTSPFYGHGLSEHRIGTALRAFPRDIFVLSSKVGRLLRPGADPREGLFKGALPFTPEFDYSYDGAMRSFEDSLQRLGLSAIDILLIHDVSPNMQGPDLERRFGEASKGAARAINDLRSQGVIKAIGAGVSDADVCMRFADVVEMDVFLLAVRYTLLDQSPAQKFLPFCRQRGISVIAAAPFVSGILATGAVPGAFYMYQPADEAILARTRAIEAVCADFGVPLAAAALQMPLGDPAVCAVLPGFRTRAEVAASVAWIGTDIPAAFWAEMKARHLIDEATLTPGEAVHP